MRMQRAQQGLQILLALLIVVGFVWLFYSTRAAVHTYDAFTYISDVETKALGLLYHPHHLLYGPTGYIAANIAAAFGYAGRVDAPIQFVNALAGALGVLVLWRFGVTLTGRVWAALPFALMMGACYGYWRYAAEVEVYTLAALFVVLCLWLLALLDEHGWRWLVLPLALSSAGAVMFHQTNALFALPVGLFLLLDQRFRLLSVAYAALTALAVALPYLLVAIASNLLEWERFYRWFMGYTQTGRWGGRLGLDTLPELWVGWSDVVSVADWRALAFYGLALLGALLGGRALWRKNPAWWALILAWLLPYTLFFWWWEPFNIEFWIVLLPLWVTLMLLGVLPSRKQSASASVRELVGEGYTPLAANAVFRRAMTRPYKIATNYRLSILAALLFISLLTAHHDPIQQIGDPSQDYYYRVVQALDPHVQQDDLVITRGNILDLYVPYYNEHPAVNLLSLSNLSYGSGDYATFRNTLFERVETAYQRGRIVILDQMILDEPRSAARNPFGLEQADIDTFTARFPLVLLPETENAWYSIGQRAAPNAIAWRFEVHLQGWHSYNVDLPRFVDGAWCFTGGADPYIVSPPVDFAAASTAEITVDLSVSAADIAVDADDASDVYGQLFWQRSTDDGFSEARSLKFDLRAGRHNYTLTLSDQAAWSGQITALRLDPITAGTAGTTCVYGLRR